MKISYFRLLISILISSLLLNFDESVLAADETNHNRDETRAHRSDSIDSLGASESSLQSDPLFGMEPRNVDTTNVASSSGTANEEFADPTSPEAAQQQLKAIGKRLFMKTNEWEAAGKPEPLQDDDILQLLREFVRIQRALIMPGLGADRASNPWANMNIVDAEQVNQLLEWLERSQGHLRGSLYMECVNRENLEAVDTFQKIFSAMYPMLKSFVNRIHGKYFDRCIGLLEENFLQFLDSIDEVEGQEALELAHTVVKATKEPLLFGLNEREAQRIGIPLGVAIYIDNNVISMNREEWDSDEDFRAYFIEQTAFFIMQTCGHINRISPTWTRILMALRHYQEEKIMQLEIVDLLSDWVQATSICSGLPGRIMPDAVFQAHQERSFDLDSQIELRILNNQIFGSERILETAETHRLLEEFFALLDEKRPYYNYRAQEVATILSIRGRLEGQNLQEAVSLTNQLIKNYTNHHSLNLVKYLTDLLCSAIEPLIENAMSGISESDSRTLMELRQLVWRGQDISQVPKAEQFIEALGEYLVKKTSTAEKDNLLTIKRLEGKRAHIEDLVKTYIGDTCRPVALAIKNLEPIMRSISQGVIHSLGFENQIWISNSYMCKRIAEFTGEELRSVCRFIVNKVEGGCDPDL